MSADKSIKYYAERQPAKQWRDFMRAMGAELSAQLDGEDLRKLMAGVGARFAGGFDVSQCTTLDELQQCVNLIWADLDWGWVEFADGNDMLGIQHLCAPLRVAFGAACSGWPPAFFEGAYQRWFDSIGIDPSLRVRQVGPVDDGNHLTFKLSRA